MTYNQKINLAQETIKGLRRAGRLVRRISGLTPRFFLAALVAYLASRVFYMLAFLLPLKAILLLASDGVPRFLRTFVSADNKDVWTLVVAVSAVFSYGLYLLADRAMSAAVNTGSSRVLTFSDKLRLFHDQTELAHDAYLRLCRLTGSAIIVSLGLVVGGYVNPVLFSGFALVLVAEFTLIHAVLQSEGLIADRLHDLLASRLGAAGNYLSAINFLIGFIILFLQILGAGERNLLLAIFCIILIRQILQCVNAGTLDLVFMHRRGPQIAALFYALVPYRPVKTGGSRFAQLRPTERNERLLSVIESVSGPRVCDVSSKWVDGEAPGVACFDVDVVAKNGDSGVEPTVEPYRLFIRCFDKKKAASAEHERQLFAAMPDGLPGAPRFVGKGEAEDGPVLLYHGLPQEPASRTLWRKGISGFLGGLWSIQPEDGLMAAYLRSHRTICGRLDREDVSRMWIAADSDRDIEAVERFLDSWENIKNQMEELPLVLDNPAFASNVCRVDEQGALVCFSWSKWVIEPAGCSRSLSRLRNDELDELLETVRASRNADGMSVRQWRAAAGLLDLEAALDKTRLRDAIRIAGEIADALAPDENSGHPGEYK